MDPPAPDPVEAPETTPYGPRRMAQFILALCIGVALPASLPFAFFGERGFRLEREKTCGRGKGGVSLCL